MAAELPEVILKDKMDNSTAIVEDDKPNFCNLVAIGLDNAGIDPQERLWATQAAAAAAAPIPKAVGPAIVDAKEDNVIYELTFDLPDTGLEHNAEGTGGKGAIPVAVDEVDLPPNKAMDKSQRYPAQSCRSAIGHQVYVEYLTPRMMFLQLGEAKAHRSVLKANKLVAMLKEECLMATTAGNLFECDMIVEVENKIDPELVTESKDKIKVWGYMMALYNVKV